MKKTDITNSGVALELVCMRSIVYVFLFLLSFYLYIYSPQDSDLYRHLNIISAIKPYHLVVPHFLYHLVVCCFAKVLHLSFLFVSCLVLASCITISTILVEQILRHFLKGRYSDLFLLLASLVLTFVSAVYFPFINKDPYLGVWNPNPWHNPTYIAAKPFVLLSFYLYVLEITADRHFINRFSLMRISVLLVICALIKPSFILAFIPASMAFCFFLPGRKIPLLVKTGQLLSPVLAVLFFQYLFTYYHDSNGASSIQFSFFDIWRHYAESVPVAVLQAVAFPLAAVIVMRPCLSKDRILFFCWGMFIIGLLIFGLLCETGGRQNDANFAWTYMFCLNILFIFSTISFLRWVSDTPEKTRAFRIKLFLCYLLFLFHLYSGIHYVGYLISMLSF